MPKITRMKMAQMSPEEKDDYKNKKTVVQTFAITQADKDALDELAYINRMSTSEILRYALIRFQIEATQGKIKDIKGLKKDV